MKLKNLILPLIILALVIFAGTIFRTVLLYLVISLVLFLIGYPLTKRLEKLKIKGRHLNDGIAALITLLSMVGVFALFFVLIFPPLIQEISFMSELNFNDVIHNILNQYPGLKGVLSQLGDVNSLKETLNDQISKALNLNNVTGILNNLIDYLGAFLGGFFCVLFITFFLLKDGNTVNRTFLLITPAKYDAQVKDILRTSKLMLSKYFTGLVIDISVIGTLAGITLWILGIKSALIIAIIAALFNVIPYIGPIITLTFALFLGVSGCIQLGQYDLISTTMIKITITLLSINLVDAIFIQPYIFSNSVKAHPLEIFLVTLMAGTIGGIGGMVVAIPVYTLIRIVAKEFLTHFAFFKKLTENIPNRE